MLIVGGVGFIMECLGCNFGLFFSKYIYLDYIPGPKLFGFNVYSAVAYAIIMLAAMAGPAIQAIARVVNDDRLVD